jgi:integrase
VIAVQAGSHLASPSPAWPPRCPPTLRSLGLSLSVSLSSLSGRYADLVLTLAFTGLRWGEAIALTVADVEFLKRRISVHRNAVQVGQKFEVGQTKGKENRTVPVAASVLSRLAARCEGRSADDLLFPARGGGYLKRPSYDETGWFNRAVERAQVQTITPHDLRHTCASLAVSSGANVLAVSRMLGHNDPSVTLRIYADLFDSDLDAVAVNLDARIADSVQSTRRPSPQAQENSRLAAVMCLSALCPRGDLNPHAR